MKLTPLEIQAFQKKIYTFYKKNKREFAWRDIRNPYFIFLSEIMLQQTQTNRVTEKYVEFIEHFPTIQDLAQADFSRILLHWKGLGYNRRAKFLHNAAQIICKDYSGKIPKDPEILITLPGIGAYTSNSIPAFAYNKPTIFIETNIRSVFIHEFFHDKLDIVDKQIFPLIEQTLDKKNPKDWYYALMDYGQWIKKEFKNPNRKSKHYTKQSTFIGSDRQIRGNILEVLLQEKKIDFTHLHTIVNKNLPQNYSDKKRFEKIVNGLVDEKIIKRDNGFYFL